MTLESSHLVQNCGCNTKYMLGTLGFDAELMGCYLFMPELALQSADLRTKTVADVTCNAERQ